MWRYRGKRVRCVLSMNQRLVTGMHREEAGGAGQGEVAESLVCLV